MAKAHLSDLVDRTLREHERFIEIDEESHVVLIHRAQHRGRVYRPR